nr:uncharacterized protein LOC102147668 isoform X1 [Equus caballus]
MTTCEGGAKGTLSREAKRLTGLFKTWIVQRGFRGPFPSGMGEHGGSVSCCPQSISTITIPFRTCDGKVQSRSSCGPVRRREWNWNQQSRAGRQDQQISSAIPSISLETNFSTSPVMPGESRAIRTLPSLSCSLSGQHGHLSSKLMWLSTKFRLEASCSLAVPPRSPLFPVCIKSLVFWGVVNLLKLK